MSDVTEDPVVPMGGRPAVMPAAPTGRSFGRSFEESFGDSTSPRGATTRDDLSEDVHGARPKYQLPESVRRGLANLEKHGSVEDRPDTTSAPAAAASAVAGPPVVGASQAGASSPVQSAAAAPAPSSETSDATTELRGAHERAVARNAELVAEVDRLKQRPQRELTKREQRLVEADRAYFDDPLGSLRKMLSVVHDVEDPNSEQVTKELSRLYYKLAAQELKVPLDAQQEATLNSEWTRMALERDKRELRAEREAAARPAEQSPADRDAVHTQIIGESIATKGTDGKSLSDSHPYLMALSQEFTGLKPEALLLAVIRNGFETGEYDRKTDDSKLITAAAAKAETMFKARYDRMSGALKPSTAQPTPASQAIASPPAGVTGQGHGTRTITNASASVAPATLPATKPATTEERPKPTWRNEKERIAQLAKKHFPDAR